MTQGVVTHEREFVDLAHWIDEDDWEMSPDSFGTEDMPKEDQP